MGPAPTRPTGQRGGNLHRDGSWSDGICRQRLTEPPRPREAALQRELDAARAAHAAEVAALHRQVLEARKQASLGELLGTTTHEFNNALTTILNYARLGLRHRDQPTRDKALERILSAGNRAAKITASVLSMARNRSARFEPVDLQLLIEDVLVLLEREMMKYRVQVEREFAPVPEGLGQSGPAPAGAAQPAGKRPAGDAERRPADSPTLRDELAGFVDLMVRDTGCGMPPEVLRRIFEPHFSTKTGPDETGKGGAGWDSASCREIVEAHRGRIRVESAPAEAPPSRFACRCWQPPKPS